MTCHVLGPELHVISALPFLDVLMEIVPLLMNAIAKMDGMGHSVISVSC